MQKLCFMLRRFLKIFIEKKNVRVTWPHGNYLSEPFSGSMTVKVSKEYLICKAYSKTSSDSSFVAS